MAHKPAAQTPIRYLLLVECTIYAVDTAGGMNPVCAVVDEVTAGLILLLLGDFHKVPTKRLDALNVQIVDTEASTQVA